MGLCNTKMYLFGRWIAMNYIDILSEKDGYWWKEKIEYFNETVYPNLIKNKSYNNTYNFIIDKTKSQKP